MLRYSIWASVIVAIAVLLLGPFAATAMRAPGRRAPAGFEVLRSVEIVPPQRDLIGAKLGAKINTFSHTSFSVLGRPLGMNVIYCPDSNEAAKAHEAILKMKSHPAYCVLLDSRVVEFMGDDPDLAVLATFELGFKPKPQRATYKVSFRAAPTEKVDYESWKKLSNLFALASADPDNLAYRSRVSMLLGGFRFGNELTLRTISAPQAGPSYSFEPNPEKTAPIAGGDLTKYTFQNLPRDANIPYVMLKATVHTAQDPMIPTARKAGPELLAPTEFWPSDDPEIISLAGRITANCRTPQQKTSAILAWLAPGKNIKFTESIASARYGVKKVLSQKFGEAWDFSDCFVTLARASKVPCRQVVGWFFSQSAHVWAEVLYEGSGWHQVEPTGGGLRGCGIYHIPYMTSEDGRMPLMYLSKPRIEFVED